MNSLLLVALFVVGICVILWLRKGWKKAEQILGEQNIADLSAQLAVLKECANSNIEIFDPSAPPDAIPPNQYARTSDGMQIAYTVTHEGELFVHHFSLSLAGQYFAESAARSLASWMGYILAIPAEQMTVLLTANRAVRHIVFKLTEEQQESYLRTAVKVLSKEQVTRELWSAVMRDREKLQINAAGATR